jgi:hypothetical protein
MGLGGRDINVTEDRPQAGEQWKWHAVDLGALSRQEAHQRLRGGQPTGFCSSMVLSGGSLYIFGP